MKKEFDCVEMKRKTQQEIYKETRHLSPDAELEYFHKAANRFWQEIRSLRENREAETAAKLK